MTFEKCDGVIEVQASGCCCPPGIKRAGLHTQGFTFWYRTTQTPWRQVRDWNRAQALAQGVSTCESFLRGVEYLQ